MDDSEFQVGIFLHTVSLRQFQSLLRHYNLVQFMKSKWKTSSLKIGRFSDLRFFSATLCILHIERGKTFQCFLSDGPLYITELDSFHLGLLLKDIQFL